MLGGPYRPESEMEETLVFPSWLDLPEPLLELVLERLPLVDYIRLAAVCPKWRSIQRGHRLRHAPHPPPMAKQLPWLIPRWLNSFHSQLSSFFPCSILQCYSPLDQKSYGLPIPRSLSKTRCLASCHGWLLLLEDSNFDLVPTSKQPILFNPITANQIPLPPVSLFPWCAIGAMSTTPTDPDCVILLVVAVNCCAFLYRPNDHCAADWTIIRLTPIQKACGGSAIYCGGKFYCSNNRADELYVIDPSLQKAASPLVMRYPSIASTDDYSVSLHEISGELFSVRMLFRRGAIARKRYQMFKADLSGQEWIRVETLGEHVLFHYDACSVLLLAADVGCKRSSIYARKTVWLNVKLEQVVCEWGSFDLGTGGWTEEDIQMHGLFGPWLLPTLDSANPTRASD